MKRRLANNVFLLLILACAVVALHHDLSQWRLTKAERAFHQGDLRAAQTGWSSASINPTTRQRALLNRGVARYRLGELTAASADFRSAAAAGDPHLRRQALYNLGTTLLVMERGCKTEDQKEAQRLLSEAVRQLQAALALLPTDSDAVHNAALARSRLAALHGGTSSKRSAQQPQEKREQGAATPKEPGQAGSEAGKRGDATNRDTPGGRRRAITALSPEQALRMLDDVRGREALRSGVAAGNRHEKLGPTEKDW